MSLLPVCTQRNLNPKTGESQTPGVGKSRGLTPKGSSDHSQPPTSCLTQRSRGAEGLSQRHTSVLELVGSKPRPACKPHTLFAGPAHPSGQRASLAFLSHYPKGIYEQQNQNILEMSAALLQMNRAAILQQKWASWLLHMLVPLPGKLLWRTHTRFALILTSSRMYSLTPVLCSCAVLSCALPGTVWNDSAHLLTPMD